MSERRIRKLSGGNPETNAREAMSKSARQEKILDMLESDGQVRISELAHYFNTSVVTIRSDLDAMDEAGLVERTPGGAVLTTITQFNRDFQKKAHADRGKARRCDGNRKPYSGRRHAFHQQRKHDVFRRAYA